LDSSRLRTGEIVAGSGGVALFVFLFFSWFSGVNALGGGGGVSGWDALTDLPGFLIILSGVAGISLAYLALAGLRVNIPVRRGAITALLGALAVLLILWRMFAGSPTLKIGIFLGLAAAVAITAGALMALREDGFQPLVAVAGGRTRVAAASAPTTKKKSPARSSTKTKTQSKSSSARSGSSKKSSSSSSGSKGKSKRSSGAKKK
jgi:hypothetical protein